MSLQRGLGPLVQKESACVWLYLHILSETKSIVWHSAQQSLTQGFCKIKCTPLLDVSLGLMIPENCSNQNQVCSVIRIVSSCIFPLSRRVHLHALLFIGRKWNEGGKSRQERGVWCSTLWMEILLPWTCTCLFESIFLS